MHYWAPEWQAIICGSPESYLDWIMDLGFDRVYLDRVDAYWCYQEQSRETVDFVIALTKYAREQCPGYIPYIADRSLGRLRINPDFEPD